MGSYIHNQFAQQVWETGDKEGPVTRRLHRGRLAFVVEAIDFPRLLWQRFDWPSPRVTGAQH